MYEIDKEKFGKFISELRKEKGMTQKELAEKLYISDKAVSKWERGHSIPDITLLIPLAEIFGISVTELLECQRIEKTDGLDVEKTDDIVKKVIGMSEDVSDRPRIKKKNVGIYLGCVLISFLEMFGLYQVQEKLNVMLFPAFMMTGMAMLFGIYFWFFMKEKLPAYYDEHKVNVYVDGVLHMNLPGVYFNNCNWKYIVKSFRIWSLLAMMVFPILYLIIMILFSDKFPMIGLGTGLFFILGGLFLPPYILAKKYQYGEGELPKKESRGWLKIFLYVLSLIFLITFISFFSNGTMRSVLIVGGNEWSNRTSWSGEYKFVDGFMQRNLWTAEEDSGFQIVIEKNEGIIGFEIKDKNGIVLFQQEQMEAGSYEVEASGKCTVRVTLDDYKGSFAVFSD